jgi:hypothetical protein
VVALEDELPKPKLVLPVPVVVLALELKLKLDDDVLFPNKFEPDPEFVVVFEFELIPPKAGLEVLSELFPNVNLF